MPPRQESPGGTFKWGDRYFSAWLPISANNLGIFPEIRSRLNQYDVCDTLARLLLQHIHDFARTDVVSLIECRIEPR